MAVSIKWNPAACAVWGNKAGEVKGRVGRGDRLAVVQEVRSPSSQGSLYMSKCRIKKGSVLQKLRVGSNCEECHSASVQKRRKKRRHKFF